MKKVFTSETIRGLNDMVAEFVENSEGDMTIIMEVVPGEDGDHWYSATVISRDAASSMKQLLVEEHGYVDFFVSSEEVRGVATDMQRELTDEELDEVVKYLSHNDLEIGLCETAIEGAISEVCPEATDQEWEEDESDELRHIASQYTPDEQ